MTAGSSGARDPRHGPQAPESDSRDAWRLFIAVPLPDEVRSALEGAVWRVRDEVRGGRWLGPETWHLTLRFLGDTARSEVPLVEQAVQAAAAATGPFEAALGHAGAFERRFGRVAWIGLERGGDEIGALARALATLLVPDELPREPFRAHLTIAREAPVALVGALDAALHAAREAEAGVRRVGAGGTSAPTPVGLGGGPAAAGSSRGRGADPFGWTVDRVVLFRSVLGRTGAQHTPLLETALGTPPR